MSAVVIPLGWSKRTPATYRGPQPRTELHFQLAVCLTTYRTKVVRTDHRQGLQPSHGQTGGYESCYAHREI
jgi:hypothetical protein